MAPAKESQKRHIAYKVQIKDILQGDYVRGEGWDPSFITVRDIRVSRIDIIASVIDKSSPDESSSTILIDDGNDQIHCRAFEPSEQMQMINVGDIVHIIGRPRDFNGERYILPEIMKKVEDILWVMARKKELILLAGILAPDDISDIVKISSDTKKEGRNSKIASEIVSEEVISDSPLDSGKAAVAEEKANSHLKTPQQQVIDMIRQMDSGKGVDMDELISSARIDRGEAVIDHLLKEGEIFEIMPGKLKVLE